MAETEERATPEQAAELQRLEEEYVRELNMAIASSYKKDVEQLIHTAMEQGKAASEVVAMMEASGMFVGSEAAVPEEAPPESPMAAAPPVAPPTPAQPPELAPMSREDEYMAAAKRQMA